MEYYKEKYSMNLFWPIYKKLEKEVIKIADYIHFDDTQGSVYSIHIGDLIIRCAVEIESIAKALYISEGGNPEPIGKDGKRRDLFFDTDCIQLLDDKWGICQKVILVASPQFFFSKDENKILRPLHKANKRGTSSSKWQRAYQAIKHNREENLKHANVSNLMNALAALFILNLYYKDENYDIAPGLGPHNFDLSCGSDIFSIILCDATKMSFSTSISDEQINSEEKETLPKAIYVLKYEEESCMTICNNLKRADERMRQELLNSKEIVKLLLDNPQYSPRNLLGIAQDAGIAEKFLRPYANTLIEGIKSAKRQIVLYRNDRIYSMTLEESKALDGESNE